MHFKRLLLLYCFLTCLATLLLSTSRAQLPLSERCRLLQEFPLQRKCTAYYNSEIKIKYKDQYVLPGTPYGVYIAENHPARYMLSFHDSNMLPCRRVRYTNQNRFMCLDMGNNSEVEITFRMSQLHCFNYSLQYVQDLVHLCNDQLGVLEKPYRNLYAALHYANTRVLRHKSLASKLSQFGCKSLTIFVIVLSYAISGYLCF